MSPKLVGAAEAISERHVVIFLDITKKMRNNMKGLSLRSAADIRRELREEWGGDIKAMAYNYYRTVEEMRELMRKN